MKVYKPHERPAVEVLVGGAWYPGELRGAWRRYGRQQFTVSWRQGPWLSRLDTVAADRVRMVDVRDEEPAQGLASS